MKKIGKTIAIVLIFLILTGSFTSCFTVNAFRGNYAGGPLFVIIPIYPILDIITSPIQILYWIIAKQPPWDSIIANAEPESHIYLSNAEYTELPEYNSLKKKMLALPVTELTTITEAINSLPETELCSLTEAVISLPEEKKSSLIKAYNSLPESEIIASMERINALSEEEFISQVRAYYSLSEAEVDSLIESLKFFSETENVTLTNDFEALSKKNVLIANGLKHLQKNNLKYYNMDMRLYLQY